MPTSTTACREVRTTVQPKHSGVHLVATDGAGSVIHHDRAIAHGNCDKRALRVGQACQRQRWGWQGDPGPAGHCRDVVKC